MEAHVKGLGTHVLIFFGKTVTFTQFSTTEIFFYANILASWSHLNSR